jgi:alkylhydroperoxidase family enzyme
MSARISPIDPPYPADMQADFDQLMRGAPPLALFRTVGRNPRVLSRMMAGGLLDKGSIGIRQRELMILRTTALCGAEYEWGVHVAAFGSKTGLSQDQFAATVRGDASSPIWNAEDAAVIRLADSLHTSNQVSDTLWAELKGFFSDEQLIELVMLAGLYHAVSYLVNATGVEPEAFAPRFPAAK